MEDPTVCCLCNYSSTSEDDLALHIDNFHSDIFRVCYDDDNAQINSQLQVNMRLSAFALYRNTCPSLSFEKFRIFEQFGLPKTVDAAASV